MDHLYEWIDDNDRLLTTYTCFYAWYRRLLLWRHFHTWIIRMFAHRHFRNMAVDIRHGIHYNSRIQLNRQHDLPNRQHYINLAMDYHQQVLNGIPLERITYRPTPALVIIADLVDVGYIVIPRS